MQNVCQVWQNNNIYYHRSHGFNIVHKYKAKVWKNKGFAFFKPKTELKRF